MIPISASCLHRRTVHILKSLFDARGEPAVQVLKTTGLWGSEDVLDTTASDEPAVHVVRTTGLPVGGDEAVLKTNAGGESAVQVLKTTGLWGSDAVLDTTARDEPAVQILKTTGLPVGGRRLSSIPLPAASLCRPSYHGTLG